MYNLIVEGVSPDEIIETLGLERTTLDEVIEEIQEGRSPLQGNFFADNLNHYMEAEPIFRSPIIPWGVPMSRTPPSTPVYIEVPEGYGINPNIPFSSSQPYIVVPVPRGYGIRPDVPIAKAALGVFSVQNRAFGIHKD